MISIVYSATAAGDVQKKLGESEYSYYFVLKEFSEALKALGPVVVVTEPAREVDPIFHRSRDRGEDCVFFSFTPPHLTTLGLDCPTIPVIAWEFDTIPNETWFSERQQDWRYVLDRVGRAITISNDTARVIKKALGEDFPVESIPAPVWDRFVVRSSRHPRAVSPVGTRLDIASMVIDSRAMDLSAFAPKIDGASPVTAFTADQKPETPIMLDGVIYLSVFNPFDWRKNWHDLIAGFCSAFRDTEDATLVLKLAHHGCEEYLVQMLEWLYRLTPFRCRVLMLTGFLESDQYETLVGSASYVVNASHGEGQCLPLMEGMARGKPAVAPCHSAMADYIDTPQAFIVRSSAELGIWPCDPRWAFRALHQRIDFDSLVEAYRQSYEVAKDDPGRYARMSEQAREVMRQHASVAVAKERLEALLRTPPRPAGPDDRYGQIRTRPYASWSVGFASAG